MDHMERERMQEAARFVGARSIRRLRTVICTMAIGLCSVTVLVACDNQAAEERYRQARLRAERCADAITREDGMVSFETRSGFRMRFLADYLFSPIRLDDDCKATSVILHFTWVNNEFTSNTLYGELRPDLPEYRDRAAMYQEFSRPEELIPTSVQEWKLADAVQAPGLEIWVYPRFFSPAPDSQPNPQRGPLQAARLELRDSPPSVLGSFQFSCPFRQTDSIATLVDYSTSGGGTCRGLWSIAPGATGVAEFTGEHLLRTLRERVVNLDELTQSFIVRED